MMKKVWLVLEREYYSRVKKRSFILITLLTPFAFLLFFIVAGLIFSYQSDEQSEILIRDEIGLVSGQNLANRKFNFTLSDDNLESLKRRVEEGEYQGLVVLPKPAQAITEHYIYNYFSDEPLDLESTSVLDRQIQGLLRSRKMEELKLDDAILASLDIDVDVLQKPVSEDGKNMGAMTSVVAAAIGGLMGYIMFFVIIFFGTQVMRSISEEKVNRIVEVVISSVRPFELMLGKILGSSAVSLTQILIWMVLIPLASLVAQAFFPISGDEMANITANGQVPEGLDQLPFIMEQIGMMNWWLIIPLFLFYFLTGFLIYAAMFAAIGAAIGDDVNDSQTLTLPVVIPIVLAVYIMFQAVREPNSSLAVWSSVFPFFSSIVMPARIPYQPDWWQIALSMIVTLGTAIMMIWLAGRIYRVGIMNYGKRSSFKDLFKWLFSSDL